jgi:hypothetical protein
MPLMAFLAESIGIDNLLEQLGFMPRKPKALRGPMLKLIEHNCCQSR